MANAITYIKNVGKSVKYASFDVIKEMNPVFKDLAESNADLTRDMYKSIKSLKQKSKNLPSAIMESEYGKFARTFKDNLFDDLKTGKFYNRERKEEYENQAAVDFMTGDDDDFNFDFGGGDSDFEDLLSDDFSTNDMMDLVGEKASSAVSNAVARSAEYMVEANYETARASQKQMNAIYGGLHAGLSTINQNISKMLEFSNEAVVTHFENSSTFYSEITRLDQERNNYLKEISEGIKQMNSPAASSSSTSRSNTYSDITSINGAIDLSAYAKVVKSNVKNKTELGMAMDMLDMIKDIGLNQFAASPLSFIATGIATKMIPKAINQSLENLNKSLSGLFGNALMKLKSKGGGFDIWSTIADIFGINTSLDTNIDPSKYEKGKIPFDGVTKKAIIEVIPTYLSKILAALTNQPESRFNYESGKFVTMDQLREEFNNLTKDSANRAASGIDSVVRTKKSKLSFRDKADEEQFDKDWEYIKQWMYKNQKNFNTRDKSINAKTYGLKGDMADENIRRLQKILDGDPEMLKYANELFREVDNQNRRMDEYRKSGIFSSLANNSESISSKSGQKSTFVKMENTVLSELESIHKELSYIRIYGTGGGGSRSGAKTVGKRVSFKNFRVHRPQNDTAIPKDTDNTSSETKEEEKESDKEQKETTSQESNKKLSAKLAKLFKSVKEKPSKFVKSIIDKADARLYDLVFGPKEDTQGKKSLAARMFTGLETMFNKFSDFVSETIIDPLKEKFTKENVHEAAKKFFGIFGIDLDDTVKRTKEFLFGKKEDGQRTKNGLFGKFADDFKDSMKSAFGWVKNAFKGVGDWFGATSKKNASGRAKAERNKARKDNAASNITDLVVNPTDIPQAYSGMKRADKTGLAIISEGEMIIPPDMNPFNVSKRKRGEDKVRKSLKSSIDGLFGFAEGTKGASTDDANKNKKEKFTREDYDVLPLWMRIVDQFSDLGRYAASNFSETFGISDDDKEKFRKTATDFIGNVKEYGGTMGAGATIGAGVSLLTGLVGGPLLGAAVGASVGLIQKSETVQKLLFGEFEDGEYKGGKVFSKDLANNIHKYLPDMSKGATVGGILTALPIIPGGPIAGIIAGSALGFAKNNEKVQEFLFGETGLFKMSKEDFQKSVQKKLPKMGAGALVGALAGPFGLGANLILGSALGFASDTNAFKDLMFGEEIDGKREGGIFGAIVTPAKDFFKKMYNDFSSFLKEHMLQPLANAVDPIKKQLQIMGKSLTDMFANSFKEHIGRPIERLITEKIVNPIGKFFGGFIKIISKPAKLLVSAPFKAIGGIGNALRTRQIKRGQADYMGAEQRNAFRRSRGARMGIGDQYADFDAALEGMSMTDIYAAQDTLTALRDSRKSSKKAHYDSFNRVKKEIYSKDNKVDTDTAKLALDMLRRGSYAEAIKFVKESNIEPNAQARILKTLEKESEKMKLADKMRVNADQTAIEVSETLNKLGFKISPEMAKKIAKGDKEASKIIDTLAGEERYRNKYKKQEPSPMDELNDSQKERHHDILQELNKIIELLSIQVGVSKNLGSDNKEDIDAREAIDGNLPDVEFREEPNFTDKRKKFNYKAKRGVRAGIKSGKAAIGSTFRAVGDVASDIRNSDPVNKILGDKSENKNWQPSISEPIDRLKRFIFGKKANKAEVENTETTDDKKRDRFDITKAFKTMTASLFALASKEGIDVSKSKGNLDTVIKGVKNKVNKGKNRVTQFVDGLPFNFFKRKDGTLIEDRGDSDNQENSKILKEKQEQQTSLVTGIKSIPSTLGNLFGKFFGKNEDEEDSWISKILKKVANPAKIAAAVAVSFGVLGWAQEKIFPALKIFWDEKLGPYFNDAWNGRKEGFGQFIYFFNPKNENGLLSKLSKFFTEDLPGVIEKAAPVVASYVSKGMNWVLRDILPGVVSTLVQNLPVILKSITTGLIDGINGLLNRKEKNDGRMNSLDGVESMITSANDPFSNMTNGNHKPSWFSKSVDGGGEGPVTGTIVSEYKGSSNTITLAEDASLSANKAMSGQGGTIPEEKQGIFAKLFGKKQATDPMGNKIPKGIQNVNPAYHDAVLKEYEKVKFNRVNTPYGVMTVAEFLDSDLPMTTAADGTPVYGWEYAKYDNLAQQLGMDVKLSQADIDKNTEESGLSIKHQAEKKFGMAGIRALTRGVVGIDTGIKGAEKIIHGATKGLSGLSKLVPGVGKTASMGVDMAGKYAEKAPGALNRFGGKLGKKIFGVTDDIVEAGAKTVGKETAENIVKGIPKNLSKAASKSSNIGKFITSTCEAIKGFFKDGRVVKNLKEAIESGNGKKLTQEAIEKMGEYFSKNTEKLLSKVGPKATAKASGKISAYLLSGSALLIADAVISFLSGMKNAKNILSITEEPSLLMKVICGIIEAFNSVFMLGLLPLNRIIDFIIGGTKVLGLNIFNELTEQRERAKEEVEKYNKEFGVELSVEEYNKKDNLWNKFKRGFKNLFGKDEEVETEANRASSKANSASSSSKDNGADSSKPKDDRKWWQKLLGIGKGSGLYVGRGSGVKDPSSENKLQKAITRSQVRESKLSDAISKNTFISQIDGRYKDMKFNLSGDTETQTLGDTGCAPAAAAMAVNATLGQNKSDMLSASKLALKYKVKDDGVNAAYFNDEFARHGISASYVTSQDPEMRKQEIMKKLANNAKVVLMGSDASNTSKSNSPFGPNPHYVVANGLSEDGKYIYINDPESKVPNIRYDASRVLGSSELGIIPSVARGSKLLKSKLSRYVGRGKYGSDTAQYKVWNGLRAAGYNEIATAAAMGNIQHESGFRASAIEGGNGIGFGLVQWSFGRRTKMENYAKSKGVDPSDINVQIEYLLKELAEGSGIWTNASPKYGFGTLTRNDWANGTDIDKATKAFMCCFERPAYSSSTNHIDRRMQAAREFYQEFTGTPISSSISTVSGETGATETSFVSELAQAFNNLGIAYGIVRETATTGDTGGTIDTSTISGNTSSNPVFAEKQKALVAKMYSIQGKLRYSQDNAKYPGSRNPDDGSGDCSSTVQWAYKNVLGVDPGSYTGAQKGDSDTYTAATGTMDESKLQLGDLLLRDGHVEMYAGNGKMIGHGGGNDGKTLGPTVKPLDKSGKYNIVRRWTGFRGSGSGLLDKFTGRGTDSGYPELASYDNALRHIKPEQFESIYPLGYDSEKLAEDKVSVMQYNGNKLLNNNTASKSKFIARGTNKNSNIDIENNSFMRDIESAKYTKPGDNMVELVKSIIKLLVQMVTNTEQLNTIVKLLGEYISVASVSGGSASEKQTALLAKQNLINTIKSGKNEPNAELMRLIEATEKLARE